MISKSFRITVVLMVAVFVVAGFAPMEAVCAEKGKPILVGAPVPRASAYGQNGERGMILAAEEINAAGGGQVRRGHVSPSTRDHRHQG